jgi:hypothetical protein
VEVFHVKHFASRRSSRAVRLSDEKNVSPETLPSTDQALVRRTVKNPSGEKEK